MKTNLFLTAALSLSLCAASTAQTLPAYLPTNGLVGWWPFNGNANDESGNGNDGEIIGGVTAVSGQLGQPNSAYYFGASADWINLPDVLTGYEYTIVISFKISSFICCYNGQTGMTLVSNFTNAVSSFIDPNGLEVGFNTDNKMYFYNGISGATLTDYTFTPNAWYNMVITHSGNELKVYINNELSFTDSNFLGTGAGASFMRVGGRANIDPLYMEFNGIVDHLGVYDRSLGFSEINNYYNQDSVINIPDNCGYIPSNLQNGLVGYWPFCGNANDESGNGNDGTVNGATLTEDRFGVANAAYSFDGVDDKVTVQNSASLNFSNQSTIAYWINYNTNSAFEFKYIAKKGIAGENGNLYTRLTPQYKLSHQLYNGTTFTQLITENSISPDYWIHVSHAYDGNKLTTYVNGIETDSINAQITLQNNNYPLYFGADEIIGYYSGKIDDIGIWNRALTAEEVQQLYTLNACTFTIYDTVTVENLVTVYDTVSVSVSTTDTLIINTLITAVEPAQENTFLVYPNPASTQITINNGNVAILGGYTMRITNSLGQDVYNQNITQPEVTLDLSSWSGNGLYVLYILDPQQNIVAVKQIVLQ